MIETLVFALAGAALMVCVLLIGRLNSIQASTVGAARALSFECRFESAGCDDPERFDELAAFIRVRHFSGLQGSVAPIGAAALAVSEASATDPFWSNPDRRPMIAALRSIAVTSSAGRLDAGANLAASAQGSLLLPDALTSIAGPQRFGLDPRAGLRTSSIEVPVVASFSSSAAGVSPGSIALRIRGRLAAVGDEWNATQTFGAVADSVQARVIRGSRLDAFREAALDAGYAMTRTTLGLADSLGLELGGSGPGSHVLDVGIVPADRRP